jgi:hypothetical protein
MRRLYTVRSFSALIDTCACLVDNLYRVVDQVRVVGERLGGGPSIEARQLGTSKVSLSRNSPTRRQSSIAFSTEPVFRLPKPVFSFQR